MSQYVTNLSCSLSHLSSYGEIFFPSEKEPNDYYQDSLGLNATASRQIFVYDRNNYRKPRFDISIILACKQIQDEAEDALYGTSSFNLMYEGINHDPRVGRGLLILKRPVRPCQGLIRIPRDTISTQSQAYQKN